MLSPKEMLYMAASKGLSYISLIGDPFRGFSVDAIREEITNGRTSLESRSLIRQTGLREWEVEGRLNTLFDFLVSSERSLTFNIWRKGEEKSQMVIHFVGKQAVSQVFKNGYYHLSFYRGDDVLMKFLLPMLGIGPQPSQSAPVLRLPSAELGGILSSIWQKTEETTAALRAKGMPEAEVNGLVGYLTQMTIFSLMIQSVRERKQSVRQRQALLFGNQGSLWWHESQGNFPETIELQPIPAQSAVFQLERLFQPVSGETSSPAQEEIIL
jgi:hypothetical protein